MNNLATVIEKLKDIISNEVGNKKVFDKHIARELDINPITFATMKSRNKIPYKEILEFCASRKILINDVLFNQKIGIV